MHTLVMDSGVLLFNLTATQLSSRVHGAGRLVFPSKLQQWMSLRNEYLYRPCHGLCVKQCSQDQYVTSMLYASSISWRRVGVRSKYT
ncbi:hypothetical protein EXIGLDRAFT_59922 [Exidia glandulosa HHB12029]|uniref:Uncharacterized protein n=1 Tax=Exidia glandulosa HHB12029 TaxID=1314781 RepID=A0A166MLW1_EXIGL|nr:hypothetical protein EXIGLDRAFT_59922 [Exidia glandulosa HHB12029]